MRMRTITEAMTKAGISWKTTVPAAVMLYARFERIGEPGSSAQNHTVADVHMACDRRIICNDDVVAQTHNREQHEHTPLAGYCCRFA